MATRVKSKTPSKSDLTDSYVRYLLTKGEPPASVFVFAEENGISERQFYAHFSSFEALEVFVWTQMMEKTMDALRRDENFAGFSAREQLLSFYYTHLEILLTSRSYIVMKWPEVRKNIQLPTYLKGYKEQFMAFAKDVVERGIEKDEIKYRARLSERYDKAFWLQLAFLIDFWCRDNSSGFEQSDAAVEKVVNLTFQLLGESALDSAIDLAKFLWQNK